MLVQHIINDRLWWFHLWMGEGSPEAVSFMHWEEEETGESIHSADELVAGLEATWNMIESALARWTVADLGHVIAQPESLTDREREIFGPSTRQWIIFHVLRHDIHHGGELAVGHGPIPPTDHLGIEVLTPHCKVERLEREAGRPASLFVCISFG